MQRRRLESDAEQGQVPLRRLFTKDYTAFVASCPCLQPTTMLQAGRSSLQLRKLESDTEGRCGRDSRHSGGFLLRIMPPSWHPVPACVRPGHSAGGQFLAAAAMALQAGRSSLQQRWRCRLAVLSCSSDGAAAIPKSGLEIKNHCTLEEISGQNMQRFTSLGLKSRITAR